MLIFLWDIEMNSTAPSVFDDFSLNLIMDAMAKNSSRTVSGEKIVFTPDLILPEIVRPNSLKTPA